MEKILRKLARSYDWQFIYIRAKELGNIKIFNNSIDFIKLQLIFLRWLEVYHILYSDLANKEDYISDEVINDDLRTEAYLLYKAKVKRDKKLDNKEEKANPEGIPGVIFRRERT